MTQSHVDGRKKAEMIGRSSGRDQGTSESGQGYLVLSPGQVPDPKLWALLEVPGSGLLVPGPRLR